MLGIPKRTSVFAFVAIVLLAPLFLCHGRSSANDSIDRDDPRIVAWADGYENFAPGPLDAADPDGVQASFGKPEFALGPSKDDPKHVVSLGDGGQITVKFEKPIRNGEGPDFAVFENGGVFGEKVFRELAFVEVSTNGEDFFQFPAVSRTPTDKQIASFGFLDGDDLENLAGKHSLGKGTLFDLAEMKTVSKKLDVNEVRYVRLIDVIGSIDPKRGSKDSRGNLINDPYPTYFDSSGFDLEAIGVLNQQQ